MTSSIPYAEGHAAKPLVAYRALDFLVSHGLAHRVERLNAFVACAHPGASHGAAFLICRGCDAVADIEGAPEALASVAKHAAFALEAAIVEAVGLYPRRKIPA